MDTKQLVNDLAIIIHDADVAKIDLNSAWAVVKIRRQLRLSWGDNREDTERKLRAALNLPSPEE